MYMDLAHRICDRVNVILNLAQDRRIAAEVDRLAYRWVTDEGLTREQAIARLATFKHRLIPGQRKRYIVLDRADNGRTGSGCLIIDTETGGIFGIKAYGVPNRIHSYGTIDDPDIQKIATAAAVTEKHLITRA